MSPKSFLAQLAPNLQPVPTKPPLSAELPVFLKWVFDFGMVIGLGFVALALIISGIYYILSPISAEKRAKAKEWLTGAVSGLLIFSLFYLIITTVNPELAIFRFGRAIDIQKLSVEERGLSGVFFYESNDCSGTPLKVFTSETFNNEKRIGSAKAIPSFQSFDLYYGVAFGGEKMQGACQFISTACNPIHPKLNDIGSVIVNRANLAALIGGGGDITLYRNSEFQEKGGYLKLSVPTIADFELKDLRYTGESRSDDIEDCTVPADRQDCIQWDKKGKCIEKQCPNLEDDIASIKLEKENQIAILSYMGPDDTKSLQSFCQMYPILGDANKTGSKQVKWDQINTTPGIHPYLYYPNFLRVFSVKK